MNLKRDKFLSDAMEIIWCCDSAHCDNRVWFSTWNGFGRLWVWAQNQDWWNDFFQSSCHEATDWFQLMINPDQFATAVYNYLKGGVQ